MTIFRNVKRVWPRSLFGRLALILFAGLALIQTLSFALIVYQRADLERRFRIDYASRDIATGVYILNRTPPTERESWLASLDRRNYRYQLGPASAGMPAPADETREMINSLTRTLTSLPLDVYESLPSFINVTATQTVEEREAGIYRLHMNLTDGTPVSVALWGPRIDFSPLWLPLVLSLALIAVLTWVAVRLATRPLAQLARAADELGTDLRAPPLREDGPVEVARAAAAFNAMQRRIGEHVAERIQILAAVSHDLQTPITLMRLRVDLLEDCGLRDKLHGDLQLMQALVEEGIAYARSAEAVNEPPCRTDLHTLLDSLVCDYADAGHPIRLHSGQHPPLMTRPRTLRRIVTNLIDNALKFGGDAEVALETRSVSGVDIVVRDRGPGIPDAELHTVLLPFRRLEGSRNRETGGTGLGLAIAHQLTLALRGALTLSNRDGGGLEARLSLPGG